MQAAAPMMAALLGWVSSRRRSTGGPDRASLAGVGVVLMAAGRSTRGSPPSGLPFLMTRLFAVVIVIARHRRDVSMMPATCTSQASSCSRAPLSSRPARRAGATGRFRGAGGGPDGPRPRALTIGARLIPPAQVAVISLLEVVLGPLWVWLAYEERPRRRPDRRARGGRAVVVQSWGPSRRDCLPRRRRGPRASQGADPCGDSPRGSRLGAEHLAGVHGPVRVEELLDARA